MTMGRTFVVAKLLLANVNVQLTLSAALLNVSDHRTWAGGSSLSTNVKLAVLDPTTVTGELPFKLTWTDSLP